MSDLDYTDFRLVSSTSTPGDTLSGARLKDRCRELVQPHEVPSNPYYAAQWTRLIQDPTLLL
jgi:hypothetical protein